MYVLVWYKATSDFLVLGIWNLKTIPVLKLDIVAVFTIFYKMIYLVWILKMYLSEQDIHVKNATKQAEKCNVRSCKSKAASYPRDRIGALRNTATIPDFLSKKISRLDKECFYSLLCKLEPILAKEKRKAEINGSGGEISPKIMLLATLRFLAGGMNIR